MSMPDESQPMGGVKSAPAFRNRNQSFGMGQNGDQGEPLTPAATPPSLVQRQQQMNSGGPARVHMSGSMNGMSSGMFIRARWAECSARRTARRKAPIRPRNTSSRGRAEHFSAGSDPEQWVGLQR